MCGNSVHQDRRFLARYMPALEAYFLYRNLDVSTLKELAKRWKPAIMAGLVKHGKHEALADIYESIEELKYYRENFLKLLFECCDEAHASLLFVSHDLGLRKLFHTATSLKEINRSAS